LTNQAGEGVDGCMAKKALKTQAIPTEYKQTRVDGDIEWLFKLYRELNERLTPLEDMLNGDVSDDEVAALEKLLAARPWYVKLASWVQRGDNAIAVSSIVFAVGFVAGMIALLAR